MITAQQTINRIARGKRNYDDGERAQEITMEMMRQLGYKLIERIETGYTVTWVKKIVAGKVIRVKPKNAFPIRKVSGDIRAIAQKGIAVHCECKYRPVKADGRLVLQWSDFESHQIEHLQAVTDEGGLAFVSWVTSLYPAELFFLLWPIPLRKGKALTAEQAAAHRTDLFIIKNPNPK